MTRRQTICEAQLKIRATCGPPNGGVVGGGEENGSRHHDERRLIVTKKGGKCYSRFDSFLTDSLAQRRGGPRRPQAERKASSPAATGGKQATGCPGDERCTDHDFTRALLPHSNACAAGTRANRNQS